MKKSVTAIFLISILFFGCRKEKFSSEGEWLGPILKTNLSLIDLLPDTLVKSNGDNSVDLVFDYSYGINSLEDVLVVPDRVETIEVSLESLVLDDRTFTDTLTLLEMYPQSALLHGQTALLPAQDITTNQGTVIDVTEQFFKTAKFNEGFIDIEISNDLPVEAELIEFQLLNDGDKSVILSGSITNLQPFSSDSQTYSLAGKTVDGIMEMQVSRIKTKASSGLVSIDIYKGLRTTFSVRDLKPEYATAVFPAQNLVEREDETKYDFGGAELTRIEVKSGSILMKVESSIEEAIVLEYAVPNSSKLNDTNSIYKEWVIPPAEPGKVVYVEERFPIDGFNIILKGKDVSTYPTFNHIYNTLIARINYTGIERT
ncbi:MAG: hypothetical protein KJP21_07395, partial [Bacteroidia bacterium]|nr:hypothetical protein [Bacteroidia bacterium]